MTCSQYKQENNGAYGIVLIDLEDYKIIGEYLPKSKISVSDNSGWSPDSSKFVLYGSQNGQTGLFSINPESRQVSFLFESENPIDSFNWSSDGKKILLTVASQAQSNNGYYYVVDSSGENIVKVNQEPLILENKTYQWGSDSNTLINRFNDDVFCLETLQLTGEKFPRPETSYPIEHGVIMYKHPDVSYELVSDMATGKMYIFDRDTSQLMDITGIFPPTYSIGAMSFSPDGKGLAFYNKQTSKINLIRIDTLEKTTLVDIKRDPKNQFDSYVPGDFEWLPDSTHIVFVQADGNDGFEINLVDMNGNITPLSTAKWPVSLIIPPQIH